ncbi:hypothetical protein OsI_36022 [Oryza sativa Indica Group]|uniref:Uncharacterized protein n=1 Tax=Oryza sativa subsp. indica TaxID=39946 RepID=B8BKD2_ORYSI|nr:hypothetical protein OsI_36022 [Oryza sativa Indica Group]
MECSDQKPNAITLLAVLGACTHGGFVDEGLRIFNKFDVYGVAAAVEHYGCLVDLLACAGRLREAYEIVKNMLVQPNEVIWCSLLGACRVHGDAEMSELVSSEIHQLHSCRVSTNDAEYILLSNIMASSERWEQAERMRRKMALHGVGKTPGCSSVELDVPEQQVRAGSVIPEHTSVQVHVAPRWGLNTHAAKIPFLGDTPGLFYYIGDLKPQAQQFILLNFFFNKKVVLRLESDNGSCCKVALFSVDYSLRECYGTSSRHASPCCREPKRRYSLLKISSMESNMRYLFMFHALQNVHTDGSEEFEINDLDQQSIDELMAENNLKKLTFARKDFKTEDDSHAKETCGEKYSAPSNAQCAHSVQAINDKASHVLLKIWANDETVRESLGVQKGTVGEWKRCNRDIDYNSDVRSTVEYHLTLMRKGYRAIIYSGDHDSRVPSISTQAWIRLLNLSIADDWRPWYVDGQVAGFTRSYASNNLTYATVKGAGHTAAEYKPKECQEMFARWISGTPL